MTTDQARVLYSHAAYDVATCADCPNAVVKLNGGWFHADEADGDTCPGLGPVHAA